MALNDQLITIDNVRDLKAVSINLDTADFDAYLKRVQDTMLKELLGDALWYDFFINITESKYVNLLNGTTYTYNSETIYYPGLKPFLSYSWLILYLTEGNINHTEAGNYQYDPATGLPLQAAQKRQGSGSYKTDQSKERNNILRYLNENDSTYPLWKGKRTDNPTQSIIDII
jgi:hypothetical protein